MYSTDGYGNYIPNVAAQQQFNAMGQYDYNFQASSYPTPAPNFTVQGIAIPAPPGMSDGWVPPSQIQPEDEEERLKREGEK
jgi:hypothetical protein